MLHFYQRNRRQDQCQNSRMLNAECQIQAQNYHRFFGAWITADRPVSPRHVLSFAACFFIVRICTPQPRTHWLWNIITSVAYYVLSAITLHFDSNSDYHWIVQPISLGIRGRLIGDCYWCRLCTLYVLKHLASGKTSESHHQSINQSNRLFQT